MTVPGRERRQLRRIERELAGDEVLSAVSDLFHGPPPRWPRRRVVVTNRLVVGVLGVLALVAGAVCAPLGAVWHVQALQFAGTMCISTALCALLWIIAGTVNRRAGSPHERVGPSVSG